MRVSFPSQRWGVYDLVAFDSPLPPSPVPPLIFLFASRFDTNGYRAFLIFSPVLRNSTPSFVHSSVRWSISLRSVRRLVGSSVHWSVPILIFRRFLVFIAHCSRPNAPMAFSISAPAHPHATKVAVYLAL